jgi:trimeric autotransporter adhesin
MSIYIEGKHQKNSQHATRTSALFALVLCYCLMGVASTAHAQISLPSSGDIGTIAGNGTQSYSGDGGAATSAELNLPYGVAVDSSGNVFIVDHGNGVIRKVTASTGDISTVAGGGSGCTGETDSYGDGCAATSAHLTQPLGVAVDSSGNLYIADFVLVRKVTASTGIITVFAGNGSSGFSGDGGPATSAELSSVVDVAIDSSGNVFIVDSSRIREVVASTGYIQTVAGGGGGCVGEADSYGDGCTATDGILHTPEGVAVDSSGNIYIADYGDDVIREVSASTGTISAIAGNYTSGYSGDGGAATSAELNSPYRVVVDASSNIYFSDYGNHVIRKVSASTGNISTVAGDGTQGYYGDGGSATSAELYYPVGVALDSSKNIYIGDSYNCRIRTVGH